MSFQDDPQPGQGQDDPLADLPPEVRRAIERLRRLDDSAAVSHATAAIEYLRSMKWKPSQQVFYNRERRHSTLGNRSPADYESDQAAVCST